MMTRDKQDNLPGNLPHHTPQRQRPFSEYPTEPWQPDRPAAPRRRAPRLLLWLLFLFACAFLAFSLTIVLGAGYAIYRSDGIFPGVNVSGLDVGGQPQATAVANLQTAWDAQTLTLAAGDEARALPRPALGFLLDAPATIAIAHEQGRTPESWRAFWQSGGRFPVEPLWQFDRALAGQTLLALAAELDRPAQEARLEYSNGRFVALPGQPGRQLDQPAVLALLEQGGAALLRNGRLDLPLTPIQPSLTDLSAIAEQANSRLTAVLAIRAYDPIRDEAITWSLPPETWADWLIVDPEAVAAGQFDWSIDPAQAAAYLQAQAASLGEGRYVKGEEGGTAVAQAIGAQTPAITLRVYHRPRQHIVQSGDTLAAIGRAYGIPYPWIQQANPNLGPLSIGQTITIPSPDDLIPLPVVENKRVVVSIAQQRTWVYEDGALKWEWPASTGIADSPTAPGIFQIQSHELNAYAGNWDLWMPHFLGIYRPVPTSGFMNGFHGFPTRGGSRLLWTGDLGRAVTYGCVLLSSQNAELLYNWAEDGVIVEIQP
jgi:lipoprotein-anchoring transpeptidase ErfK/SrfK